MTLPVQFSNNKNPTGPQLDQDFLAIAAMGVIACSYSGGPSAITLTPLAGQPDVPTYANNLRFSMSPTSTSTGAVTAQVGSLGFVKVFTGPTTQANIGDIQNGAYYQVIFLQTLDSGAGGFLIYSAQTAVSVTILNSFIGGMALSNDGSLPNTTIDVAKGVCSDSLSAAYISLSSFTKKTSGAWTAGSGNNGMGTGLTATLSTWYHVFAIINLGVPDVYFDTSVTAANKPTNTTAFRRLGSIKLDGSVHILPFLQYGSGSRRLYQWTGGRIQDISAQTTTTANRTLYTLASVPLGIKVDAYFAIQLTNVGAAIPGGTVTSPDEADNVTLDDMQVITGNTRATGAKMIVRTNTVQQIGVRTTVAAITLDEATIGWYDDL